jgi:hypothetical protein
MSEPDLEPQQGELISIHDGYWDWIFVRTYDVRAYELHTSDELLAGLIRHPSYEFITPVLGETHSQGPYHGPYRLSHVVPEAFATVTADEVVAVLVGWVADLEAEVSRATDARLQLLFSQIRAVDYAFMLNDLGPPAEVRWRFLGPYHEFVLLDHQTRSISLVIASDD